MTGLRLKPSTHIAPPFSWSDVGSDGETPATRASSSEAPEPSSFPVAPTAWLSARDMKIFGASPMGDSTPMTRCATCNKPILQLAILEHVDNCERLRSSNAAGGSKSKNSSHKKRKASSPPADPTKPKKAKPLPKITKGRLKGPVDFDKQCGVINDKHLPCSRSLTCKSHSMGAKRAVEGRTRLYDDLLLEWNRANNPNWVEPVKRETKAEKKEKRDKEKEDKRRELEEARVARGESVSEPIAPTTTTKKEKTSSGVPGEKKSKKPSKKTTKKAAAALAAAGEDAEENYDDIDSEAEVDSVIQALHDAMDKGVIGVRTKDFFPLVEEDDIPLPRSRAPYGSTIGVPMAVPADTSTWFVARRERARVCRDLLAGALMGGGPGSLLNGKGR